LAVPKERRSAGSLLQVYAAIFNSVEVNSSFYMYHREATYRRWRNEVPPDFEFALKAHRDITHVHRLVVNGDVLESINQIEIACHSLKTRALLVQTPASLTYSRRTLSLAKELFENLQIPRVQLAWETRGSSWSSPESRRELKSLLSSMGITHAVDPFRTSPVHVEKLYYFRLHGLGERMYDYRFSQEDLLHLRDLLLPYRGMDGFLFFNNYAMYVDAQKFLQLLSSSGKENL